MSMTSGDRVRRFRDRRRAAGLPANDPITSRRRSLRRLGITEAEYDALFEAQGGRCAICREPEIKTNPRTGEQLRLSVDHDHRTGRIRGLLCVRCNYAIVGASGESTALLSRAIEYLRAA